MLHERVYQQRLSASRWGTHGCAFSALRSWDPKQQSLYTGICQWEGDYSLQLRFLAISAGIGDFSLSRSETTELELSTPLGPASLSVVVAGTLPSLVAISSGNG